MAKKRPRRGRKGRLAVLPVNGAQLLGTLADGGLLKIALLGGNLLEDLFIISADLTITIRDLTPGQGPIMIGFAHSDYGTSEIVETLGVAVLGPQQKIEQERANRLVRRWGVFDGQVSEDKIAAADGGPRRYKIRWTQQDGADLNAWAWNNSGAALSTTDPTVEIDGFVYGKWLL